MTARLLAVAMLLAGTLPAFAQNDTDTPERPAAAWHFEAADEWGLSPATGRDAGPRPPTYPAFAVDNRAGVFSAKHPSVTVRDDARLRFDTKDTVTLEAWVQVDELKDGSYAYLVGKGRTGKTGFAEKNQNYALRLKGEKGEARVSFLFASVGTPAAPGDWHRWTTSRGFALAGWHHVAVRYTFGDAKSVRGFVDGDLVPGTWDMGGATDRPPVSDADDLTIGTGNGGGANNAFRGRIDDLMIWRTGVPDATLRNRYQFVPPPPALDRTLVPRGQVLVQLCETGMPTRNAWPDRPPPADETYREDAFGFFDVPQKYVDTGVRGDRHVPYLLRAAAVVPVAAGKHRLLLRGRGASRLYVDGKLVLTIPFPTGDGSGHGSVRTADSYLNLGPDFRFAPPGNREAWATFDAPGGDRFVILETVVGSYLGGGVRRPELGETVVAISPEGQTGWTLLTPAARAVPYTDAGWAAYHAERSEHYATVNAAARAARRQEHAGYWQKRRDAARDWLGTTAEEPVPPLPAGYPANNPIDHFLAVRIAAAKEQAATAKKGTIDFFEQVQPILEAKCAACHAGETAKGGLRLDSRAAAVAGGKTDGPAVTPGDPKASAIVQRVRSTDDGVMPPKGDRLTAEQIRALETWVREGAAWPDLRADHTAVTALSTDLVFLRRVFLDTVGVVPSLEEIRAFEKDPAADKRANLIDRLLADSRAADHGMGYWLDVLAENPNILNPTLNNTGPFRWWLHESLADNKPMDLVVTELVRMKGSERYGGPAGFGVASQNDVPMAAKGTVVAAAFLGVEMKCARCHDAPGHRSTQADLFGLAALLAGKPLKLPASSSVPMDKIHTAGGRTPLIRVTLTPGTEVPPAWPFARFVPEGVGRELAEDPNDSRDRLAALLTAPQNERFAQVVVNRVWKRLMGRGLVEPAGDWERARPSHPELLRWLARDFVRHGYDVRHLSRLILNSHAYQRTADASLAATPVLFTAPARRRLTAEQIVDSLFAATGKPMNLEEVSLDIDGAREAVSSISLGVPRRAWMLTSTSNERDRPSLSLPRIQAVADVLAAFGWRGARQDPLTDRDVSPNVLQPAILQNGVVGGWLTRLSDDHGLTPLAVAAESPEQLVEAMTLRLLTRPPTADERKAYTDHLRDGFATRRREVPPKPPAARTPVPYVTWSNHLAPEATLVRQRQEAAARAGDPPTDRLDPAWRKRAEDVLWALVNAPEFVFTP